MRTRFKQGEAIAPSETFNILFKRTRKIKTSFYFYFVIILHNNLKIP